jgi:hypothetical protein
MFHWQGRPSSNASAAVGRGLSDHLSATPAAPSPDSPPTLLRKGEIRRLRLGIRRLIVRVNLRRLGVRVAHPVLDRAQRHAGVHRRADAFAPPGLTASKWRRAGGWRLVRALRAGWRLWGRQRRSPQCCCRRRRAASIRGRAGGLAPAPSAPWCGSGARPTQTRRQASRPRHPTAG